MAEKGILVVVSGFSGAGKGTLMKRLMEKYDNYALSVSATTRAPRPGEEHGREYFFHTKQEFEELILQDALIEYAQYVENYYGTPKAYVEKQLNAGKDVILEIEIQGALKVKKKLPDTLLLFVTPPTAEELKNRLVNRGTETMEVIESRLRRASEEAQGMSEYDLSLIHIFWGNGLFQCCLLLRFLWRYCGEWVIRFLLVGFFLFCWEFCLW